MFYFDVIRYYSYHFVLYMSIHNVKYCLCFVERFPNTYLLNLKPSILQLFNQTFWIGNLADCCGKLCKTMMHKYAKQFQMVYKLKIISHVIIWPHIITRCTKNIKNERCVKIRKSVLLLFAHNTYFCFIISSTWEHTFVCSINNMMTITM